MKEVSKKEFDDFIANYPRKLEVDYFMEWYSYNDFTLGDKDSIVAMESDDFDGAFPKEYKIKE